MAARKTRTSTRKSASPAKRRGSAAKGRGGAARFRLPGWLSGTPGVAAAGLAVLGFGALLGWGLGSLRDSPEERPAAAVPAPKPSPRAVAEPLTAPPPGTKPAGEQGAYSRAEIEALERALEAVQNTPQYGDSALHLPDGPPVTATRPPLWDPAAEDERVAALPPVPAPDIPRIPDPVPEVQNAGPPAWLANAMPPASVDGRPMVSVIIDDMGVDRRRTREVIDLGGPLTASFLTYAPDVGDQARAARAAGMELMVHMPMEPGSATINAGPDVLTTDMEPQAIRARFTASLGSFDGYVGVNNHMGSRFTADAGAMRPVVEVLRERGLLWLDSRTTAETAGPALARELDVPFAERNVFLDHFNTLDGVRTQLATLEEVARKHGYAIGIGHPKDHTIEALAEWMPGLEERGFVLVPVSTVVRLRQGPVAASSR